VEGNEGIERLRGLGDPMPETLRTTDRPRDMDGGALYWTRSGFVVQHRDTAAEYPAGPPSSGEGNDPGFTRPGREFFSRKPRCRTTDTRAASSVARGRTAAPRIPQQERNEISEKRYRMRSAQAAGKKEHAGVPCARLKKKRPTPPEQGQRPARHLPEANCATADASPSPACKTKRSMVATWRKARNTG